MNRVTYCVVLLGIAIPHCLGAAMGPHKVRPDPGLIAAVDSQSTVLAEGVTFGDFEALYPGIYPGFSWAREVRGIGSNGLFQVDYVVIDNTRRQIEPNAEETRMRILLFRPDSSPGGSNRVIQMPAQPVLETGRADRGEFGTSAAQFALQELEGALFAARSYATNIRYYTFSGDSRGLNFASILPVSFPGVIESGGALTRRVSIHLEPAAHGGQTLLVEHAPLLLDLQPGKVEPVRVTLATDVWLFHLQYWDTNGWVEVWAQTNELPRLVQFTLGLGHSREHSESRQLSSRIVALPARPVPPEVQSSLPAGLTNGPPANRPMPGP